VFVVEVVLGVIAVLVLAVLLASVGGGLPPSPPDTDDPPLPADRLMTSEDIATLRFRTAARGYRMEDVDAAMAAVHAALWAAEQSSEPERAKTGEVAE
jgi:DivIVA domain-containing protein